MIQMRLLEREHCRYVSTMHGELCAAIPCLIREMLKYSVNSWKDFRKRVRILAAKLKIIIESLFSIWLYILYTIHTHLLLNAVPYIIAYLLYKMTR